MFQQRHKLTNSGGLNVIYYFSKNNLILPDNTGPPFFTPPDSTDILQNSWHTQRWQRKRQWVISAPLAHSIQPYLRATLNCVSLRQTIFAVQARCKHKLEQRGKINYVTENVSKHLWILCGDGVGMGGNQCFPASIHEGRLGSKRRVSCIPSQNHPINTNKTPRSGSKGWTGGERPSEEIQIRPGNEKRQEVLTVKIQRWKTVSVYSYRRSGKEGGKKLKERDNR